MVDAVLAKLYEVSKRAVYSIIRGYGAGVFKTYEPSLYMGEESEDFAFCISLSFSVSL